MGKVKPEEKEAETANDRMAGLVTAAEMDVATLVGDVRDVMLDMFKVRPKPWSAMEQAEQMDVARAIEYAAKELVGKVVDLVKSEGLDSPIKAILETYQEAKDGTIKGAIKIKTVDDADTAAVISRLHGCRGKMVLMVKASPEDYSGQRGEVETDADQRGLQFEAGNDHPADDADLAGDVDQAESDVIPPKEPAETET